MTIIHKIFPDIISEEELMIVVNEASFRAKNCSKCLHRKKHEPGIISISRLLPTEQNKIRSICHLAHCEPEQLADGSCSLFYRDKPCS